jgi:hypothetical protein
VIERVEAAFFHAKPLHSSEVESPLLHGSSGAWELTLEVCNIF